MLLSAQEVGSMKRRNGIELQRFFTHTQRQLFAQGIIPEKVEVKR